jgi:release factor glutamine methyltransferase
MREGERVGDGVGDERRVWTALEVVRWVAGDLVRRDMPAPRLEAELLVAAALGTDRVGLYVRHDAPLTGDERACVRDLVRRRRAGEPTAYITGLKEFWSIPIRVDRRVLVPRWETELLIEAAIDAFPDRQAAIDVVDVGTGSGALAAAICRERPAARVVAIDIDPEALAVAGENLARLGFLERVSLLRGDGPDLLFARPGSFDLVLANPPYVAAGEIAALPPEVRYEPRAALDGGADGLDVIRRLVPAAAVALRPGGRLLMEIGCDQGAAAAALAAPEDGWASSVVRNDGAGRPRMLAAVRAGSEAVR